MELCIGSRLFTMLKEEVGTDVTFVLQGVKVRCHRLILQSCKSTLKDLVSDGKDTIDIGEDLAPHTFVTVLKFIYTDDTEVNDANIFELLHAAKVFNFVELERLCADFVDRKLNDKNIQFFAGEALKFDAKETQKVCQEYFGKNTRKIITHSAMLEVSQEVLVLLCGSKQINCSEFSLFLACMKWVSEECKRRRISHTAENRRIVMGEVVKQIRFPLMTKEEFAKVIRSDILTFEEVGQVTVGFHNRQKITDLFSSVDRTEPIKVKIKDPKGICCTMTVPLSLSILDLKGHKIWKGVAQSYRTDNLFTLGYKGCELEDQKTLSSIDFVAGEDITLEIHTVNILVSEFDGKIAGLSFYFPFLVKDLPRAELVIKGQIFTRTWYSHSPDKVRLFTWSDTTWHKFKELCLEPGVTVFWRYNQS